MRERTQENIEGKTRNFCVVPEKEINVWKFILLASLSFLFFFFQFRPYSQPDLPHFCYSATRFVLSLSSSLQKISPSAGRDREFWCFCQFFSLTQKRKSFSFFSFFFLFFFSYSSFVFFQRHVRVTKASQSLHRGGNSVGCARRNFEGARGTRKELGDLAPDLRHRRFQLPDPLQ